MNNLDIEQAPLSKGQIEQDLTLSLTIEPLVIKSKAWIKISEFEDVRIVNIYLGNIRPYTNAKNLFLQELQIIQSILIEIDKVKFKTTTYYILSEHSPVLLILVLLKLQIQP